MDWPAEIYPHQTAPPVAMTTLPIGPQHPPSTNENGKPLHLSIGTADVMDLSTFNQLSPTSVVGQIA